MCLFLGFIRLDFDDDSNSVDGNGDDNANDNDDDDSENDDDNDTNLLCIFSSTFGVRYNILPIVNATPRMTRAGTGADTTSAVTPWLGEPNSKYRRLCQKIIGIRKSVLKSAGYNNIDKKRRAALLFFEESALLQSSIYYLGLFEILCIIFSIFAKKAESVLSVLHSHIIYLAYDYVYHS
jgi:hypothetical protein